MKIHIAVSVLLSAALTGIAAIASTETLKTPFAISADARSEHSSRFTLPSPGRITLAAEWKTVAPGVPAGPLRLALLRPDGSEAASGESSSPARIEYALSEMEADRFNAKPAAKWAARISNPASGAVREVHGAITISIPVTQRTLEDSAFALPGEGNAIELPVQIPAPGRVLLEATWEAEPPAPRAPVPLTISLAHPGLNRIYARRSGTSGLRIEQQISESEFERGSRLIVRLQNDRPEKLKGRIRLSLTPSI